MLALRSITHKLGPSANPCWETPVFNYISYLVCWVPRQLPRIFLSPSLLRWENFRRDRWRLWPDKVCERARNGSASIIALHDAFFSRLVKGSAAARPRPPAYERELYHVPVELGCRSSWFLLLNNRAVHLLEYIDSKPCDKVCESYNMFLRNYSRLVKGSAISICGPGSVSNGCADFWHCAIRLWAYMVSPDSSTSCQSRSMGI